MPFCAVKVSAVIEAPADRLYGILADYRDGHPRILPPCFSALEVEQGGRGAGTRIRFKMRVLGNTTTMRMAVTEPEPGRVLKEVDLKTGVVTLFLVEPVEGGRRTRVTIDTDFSPVGSRGIGTYLLVVWVLRRIYRQELALLAAVAARGGSA